MRLERDLVVTIDKKDRPLNMRGKSAFQMAVILKIINHSVNKIMKNKKDIIQQSLLNMNENVAGIVEEAKVKYQDNIIIKVVISHNQGENSTVIRLKITKYNHTIEINIKRREITTMMNILISHQKEEVSEVFKLNNITKNLT